MKQVHTDVLIVGSGPIGATFARVISDTLPGRTILMVELGPRLTERAGMHVKNIDDARRREQAQIQSQGPHRRPYPLITVQERANAVSAGQLSVDLLGRPGTHLVSERAEDLQESGMPAAACSTNVGGMAAHWTCACPRPGNAERIPFIAETDYEHAFSKAEQLLCVTQTAFTETPEGEAIRRILGSIFDSALSHDRRVQPMPLACSATEDGRQYWVGPDVILGPLADPGFAGHFALRADTLCRRLYTEGSRVTGALLEYLPTGAKETVHADVVIVACDALRTPQLLWASDIRPRALGHYLNEHPFIFCAVELDRRLVERWATTGHLTPSPGLPAVARSAHVGLPKPDPVTGVFWVPFDAPGHPFHGQIMHLDVSPLQIRTPHDSRHIVGLGWGCLKEVRYEDCIEFSGTEADFAGMPAMRLRYRLTERDRMEIDQAKVEQRKAAAAFGRHIQEGGQTLMPAGTSLHMQGTVRMGAGEDGTSVCDSYSRVWGYDNLFVGGNGVIPTATTSNPTLTSVAMAVRASERVVAILE